MFGAGSVVVGIKAGAATDAAGNGSTASTGGSGDTINYNGVGTFRFAQAAHPTDENTGTVEMVVSRAGGSDGPTQVSFATADDTATAGSDYTAVTGTLNWAGGDTTDGC